MQPCTPCTQHPCTHPPTRTSTYPRLIIYLRYASKYVSVRVDNEHVKLRSWEHAVAALEGAQASGASYWCSLLEGVRHPDWWPEGRHVPNYDQVGVGLLPTNSCAVLLLGSRGAHRLHAELSFMLVQ